MRRIFVLFLALALMCGSVNASPINNEVLSTTISSNAAATSDTIFLHDSHRSSFFINTDFTGSATLTATLEFSIDNSTWLSASFFDFAGGSTLQTSQAISADGDYFFWVDDSWSVQNARVIIKGSLFDGADTVDIVVDFAGNR